MKSNVKKILFIIVGFIFLLFLNSNVNAASAKIECGAEIEVNKPITISVKGTGVQWNLKLLVDGKVIATSSELENFESNKTISFSKEYTPTTEGDKKITIEGSVTEFTDGSTITKFEPKTLKVNAKKEENPAGGNNGNNNTAGGNTSGGTQTPNPTPDPEPVKVKLQSLKINSTIYIKQLKTNLSATVEGEEDITLRPETSDGSSCTITNSTNGEKYTVNSKASQKVKLNEGTNKITVTGKFDETYTVTVTNKKKEEETEPNVIEEPEDVKVILKSLSVKGVKLEAEENEEEEKIDLILTPEFSSEVYEYTINIPEEQNDITKLDIEAIGDKEDFTVEITGNENLVDGENIITILVKSKDGEKTAEYKIKVNKVAKVVEAVTEPVLDETPNTGVEDDSKDIIKVAIVGIIALIVAVAIIVILIKSRNRKEDDEETELFDDMEIEDNEVEQNILENNIYENEKIENKEENTDYVSNEENNKSNGIDFASILKNKIAQKNEISNKKRRTRNEEEFEDVEDTFEELKEEDTSSRKRGKHF